MDYEVKLYVDDIEQIVDKKLKKWKKMAFIQNDDSIQYEWQFDHARFLIDFYYGNNSNRVKLRFISPHEDSTYEWNGFNKQTQDRIIDRVGNLAMKAMDPKRGRQAG